MIIKLIILYATLHCYLVNKIHIKLFKKKGIIYNELNINNVSNIEKTREMILEKIIEFDNVNSTINYYLNYLFVCIYRKKSKI